MTSWLRGHRWIGVGLTVLLLASYTALRPFLTVWKLKAGVEEVDVDAIAECVDFPALKQNLKAQLQAKVARDLASDKSRFGDFAADFWLSYADDIIEIALTPKGLAELMGGQKPRFLGGPTRPGAPLRRPFEGAMSGYESFGEFVVRVPAQSDEMRFVLTRSGIDWKLSRIEIAVDR